jgi:RNA polymerase sigma factor (sigma-70 family)
MKNLNSPQDKDQVNLLWSRLKLGDRKGLEGIYLIFSKILFKYGLAIYPNENFIQDCIQEIFIDLWNYRKGLKQVENVKVYLLKILSNKIFKEIKKERKRGEVFSEEVKGSELHVACIETEVINYQSELIIQKKIAEAIDSLPLRQKEIILYLFFENLSYEEVSIIMDINLKSSYTLAWKAISSLKKMVADDGQIFT